MANRRSDHSNSTIRDARLPMESSLPARELSAVKRSPLEEPRGGCKLHLLSPNMRQIGRLASSNPGQEPAFKCLF
jgi:hypothetical protein